MLENQLEKLGFHKNEIHTYLTLFELGKARAGEIIEATKLHRNLVYTSLEKLEQKNLVSRITKKGVALFEANDPQSLVEMVEEQKNIAEEIVEELKKKQEEIPRDIKVFEGLDGVVRARERSFSLPPEETVYVLGGSGLTSTPEFDARWIRYHRQRIKKKINCKILFDRTVSEEYVAGRNSMPRTKAKYLPFSVDLPAMLEAFGNTLSVAVPGGDPIVFSMRSPAAAESIKKYFDYFWNNNVTTLRGEQGAKAFMDDTLNCSDVYWIGGNGGIEKFYPEVWKEYKHKRIERRVFWHDLIDPDMVLSSIEPGKTIYSEPYYEYKILPENVSGPHVICIYGNKVANIVWQKESVINIIEDEKVAESYKKYFHYLWNQEVKVATGMEALRQAFYSMQDELAPGEEYYVLGASTNTYDEAGKVHKLFNEVHERRIRKGVVVKMLAYREYMQRGRQRFIDCGDPEGKISFIKPFISMPRVPMQINLYKNKTLIIFYGETPTILTFERPEMYAGFKAYFDSQWNQETYILKGPEALRDIWLEAIDAKELRFIGARGYFIDRFPKLFQTVLEKAKKTKGIVWKNIVDPGMRGHQLTKFPWSQTRYTVSNTKNFNVVWLYGGKVSVVNWAEDEPIIFISENKHLVQSYNDYFEELWKK